MAIEERNVEAPRSSENARILIVEDDPYTAAILGKFLKTRGYTPRIVHSGQEALDLLQADKQATDLVLLDIMMPGVDGYEVCARIRADEALRHIPIIMLTAKTDTTSIVRGLELGAEDYVVKPFHNQELLARIRSVLRTKALEQDVLQRNRELSILNAMATAVNASSDPEGLLDRTVEELLGALSFDGALVHVRSEQGEGMVLRAYGGVSQEVVWGWETRLQGRAPWDRAMASGELVEVEALPGPVWSDGEGVGSGWCVPLRSSMGVHGVLTLLARGEHGCSDSEQRFLRLVGEQIGMAVERRRLFEAIRASEEKYRSSLDKANDAILSVDLGTGRITGANRSAQELMGLSEGAGDQKIWDLHPPEETEDAKQVFQDARQHGVALRSDMTFLDREGNPVPMDISANVIQYGDQAFVQYICRDATERKKLQERMVQSERLEALGRMTGGIAHDFNNLLAIILGNAQVLLREDLDPALHKRLEIIERTAADGGEIIKRMQAFTGMRRDVPFFQVDLNEIVQDAVTVTRARWRDAAQARGVDIEVRTELTDLGPVEGNEVELGEVLVNLILNAVDAMPQGGQIILRTRSEGDHVCVEVEDTGEGMTEEVLQRVFEPFFTTKGAGGNGLGLSVAYGIITQHGGQIEFASEPGRGTRCTVQLPLSPHAEEREEPVAPQGPVEKARVLVVEDDEEIGYLLSEMLTDAGHEATVVNESKRSLQVFSEGTFDIVFTDLGMPGMSGWEVTQAIKQRAPDMPVVMITGWGEQEDLQDPATRGVDLMLSKPFRIEDISRVMAQVLGPKEKKE